MTTCATWACRRVDAWGRKSGVKEDAGTFAHVKRHVVIGALALLAVTACGGTTVSGSAEPVIPVESPERATVDAPPSPTPTPTPEEPVVEQPGPQFDQKMQGGMAHVVVDAYSWRSTGTGDRSKPPSQQYLVLRLTITATSGTVTVNPLYYTVRQPDGSLADPTMGADGNEPLLGVTELGTGESISGVVTFDVPPQNTILAYTDETGTVVGAATIPAPA